MRWEDVRKGLFDSEEAYLRAMREEFPYRPVADAIVGLRARLHLTQTQLAEKIGASQSVIARAESGKHPVEVSLLRRIADACGVDWHVYFEANEIADGHHEAAAQSS